MSFKMKAKNIWKIVTFHIFQTKKIILLMLISLLVLSCFIVIFFNENFNNGIKKCIAAIDYYAPTNNSINIGFSLVLNFSIIGSFGVAISFVISMIFSTKIISTEFKNGNIFFWLTHNKKSNVLISKLLTLQCITFIIFVPSLFLIYLYCTSLYDKYNLLYVFLQFLIFLLTLFFFNTIVVFINIISKNNIYIFSLYCGIFLLWLVLASTLSEIYYFNPQDWSFCKYNKYFSLELFMPMLLRSSSKLQESIWIKGDEQKIFKISEYNLLIILGKLFLLQPILGLILNIGSITIWNKREIS